MQLEEQPFEISAQPSALTIVKNVFGTFLILILAGAMDWFILVPELQRNFAEARLNNGVSNWVLAMVGSVIVLFLSGFPAYLIVQGLDSLRKLNDPNPIASESSA